MAISTGTAILGGAAVSGLMGMNAASSAADAQAGAAAQSDATQRYIFDQSRADQLPFLNNGTAASNRLAQLLGLRTGAPGLVGSAGGAPSYNADLYNSNPAYKKAWDEVAAQHSAAYNSGYTSGSDRNWIDSQVRQRMGSDAVNALTPQADESFGSLMKPITRADIEADPTYAMGLEFGLNEGTKGINRQAAATGNLLSGATLKALSRFGTDYAGTKANDAVNRINAGRQQQYSFLGGMSGAGQAAAGQTQAAGQQYASAVGQNAIGVGNARAASAIGQSNALTGALGQGWNMYQGNQLMNSLQRNNAAASIYNGGYNFDNGNMISLLGR